MTDRPKQITFTIPGEPQGKARPRVTRTKTGRSLTYTPDKTVAYEELVRQRYIQAAEGQAFPKDQAVGVAITAFFRIPQSKPKKWKQDAAEQRIRPMKKPDVDNICKIICDALNSVAYHDDSQVVFVTVDKIFTEGEPRVEVSLSSYFDA